MGTLRLLWIVLAYSPVQLGLCDCHRQRIGLEVVTSSGILTSRANGEGQAPAPYIDMSPIHSPIDAFIGATVSLPVIVDALANLYFSKKKDGARSKPTNCPVGTLPIDTAKKSFGLDHDAVETIKEGSAASPTHWTGIAPNGDIWVGTQDGKCTCLGNISDYGFGR